MIFQTNLLNFVTIFNNYPFFIKNLQLFLKKIFFLKEKPYICASLYTQK
jgi:hypothetical protein